MHLLTDADRLLRKKARSLYRTALKAGKVRRADRCQHCRRHWKMIHGHHDDYSKPLEILSLCQPCHTLRHRQLAALMSDSDEEWTRTMAKRVWMGMYNMPAEVASARSAEYAAKQRRNAQMAFDSFQLYEVTA